MIEEKQNKTKSVTFRKKDMNNTQKAKQYVHGQSKKKKAGLKPQCWSRTFALLNPVSRQQDSVLN